MNRKDFIKTGGRILILGGMAVSAGYLVVSRKVDSTCSVASECSKCGKFSDCKLPQAREVKDGTK